MARHERSYSQTFEVDETQASGILAKTLHENKVFLSGSSVGKGLISSAKHYIETEATEGSFYVVDIGMVVSQGMSIITRFAVLFLFRGRHVGCFRGEQSRNVSACWFAATVAGFVRSLQRIFAHAFLS